MKSAEVFGPFIFVHLMCNMIQLACAVFQLDLVIYPWFPSHLRAKEFIEFQELRHIDFNVAFLVMVSLFKFLNLSVFCLYGKLATDSFEQMEDLLYESNWYELPVGLQKHVIIMIGNMQRPICYHGFGKINLDLDTLCNARHFIQNFFNLNFQMISFTVAPSSSYLLHHVQNRSNHIRNL